MVIFRILFLIMIGSNALCQDYAHTQNKIKSIYVYNFIKDVQWPVMLKEDEVVICVLAKDGFFDELEKLASTKRINDRKITIKHISSLATCNSCDLVFVDEQFSGQNLVRDESCKSFIVTHGFFKKDISNIVLMYLENKLQFSINAALCDKYGFKISTHLSSLSNRKLVQP